MSSFLCVDSLVDEVDGLRFELVGTVQVSQNEDLCSVFHRQTGAQCVLAHDLQSLQSVLKEKGRNMFVLISIHVVFAATVQVIFEKIISASEMTAKRQSHLLTKIVQ